MKSFMYQKCVELTNTKFTTTLLRKFVTSSASKRIIPSYAKTFQIPTEEIDSSFQSYASLQDFFTRRIPSSLRNVNTSTDTLTSPVDGKIEAFGTLSDSFHFHVKGQAYSIEEMVGKELAQEYANGSYIVCYLSPANYHRIHSPLSANRVSTKTYGLTSYPVNKAGLRYGKRPLSKNFRKIVELKNDQHSVVLAMIGAMFVNSIHLMDTTIYKKGDEIGYFSFGSTVILLSKKEEFAFAENLRAGDIVKFGEPLGYML
ncbi:phosphatidylserine decarboxylase [Paenisporosarcina cavernae]|uniref:phosphatidylserine decarboxylase n=1 Tax=Paenisporosarcina cavernae TaxID=2320858 RepID=A0A385YSA4_9BACL|nr:phosphatidylserine decarboxylase [Paenisporosarcina cavernae]AYC29695.1 phosphatidylserine decarboxylase [Paenisporosarcina cavernae]